MGAKLGTWYLSEVESRDIGMSGKYECSVKNVRMVIRITISGHHLVKGGSALEHWCQINWHTRMHLCDYTYMRIIIFFQEYLMFVCTYEAEIFIYRGLHDASRASLWGTKSEHWIWILAHIAKKAFEVKTGLDIEWNRTLKPDSMHNSIARALKMKFALDCCYLTHLYHIFLKVFHSPLTAAPL